MIYTAIDILVKTLVSFYGAGCGVRSRRGVRNVRTTMAIGASADAERIAIIMNFALPTDVAPEDEDY